MSAADSTELLRATTATFEELLQVHERSALAAVVALENERARLRELLTQIPASVSILTGPDHVFDFLNPTAKDFTGRGDEILGMPAREAFPELDPAYFDLLDSVYRTGRAVTLHESRADLRRKPDAPIEEAFINASYLPMVDGDGETTGVLVFATDVTDLVLARHRAEHLLAGLRSLASASLEMTAHLSVSTITRIVVRRVCEIIGARTAILDLVDFGEPVAWPAGADPAPNRLSAAIMGRDGRAMGSLTVTLDGPANDTDGAMLTQIGNIAGVAITNASRFEQEHEIALKLQRSLLPESLPKIPGMEIAVRYLPGGKAEQVGGDWYDVLTLADGSVVLVLGDVGGRGIEAATVMGQIRMALRAYAFGGNSPSQVMEKTDRLLQSFARTSMATVVYLSIPADGGPIVACSAGHPPPMLVDPDGEVAPLPLKPSVPLGTVMGATFTEQRFDVAPGSTLLLYTDGLVERRGQTIDDGIARLSAAASGPADGTAALADRVLDSMLEPSELNDDVALLAARLPGVTTQPFHMRLPAVPQSVTAVRRQVGKWLRSLDVGDDDAFDICVAVAEACANAVQHAQGPAAGLVEITAAAEGGELVVTVRDRGRWRTAPPSGGGRGLRIINGFMNDVDLNTTGTGTEISMRRALRRGTGR